MHDICSCGMGGLHDLCVFSWCVCRGRCRPLGLRRTSYSGPNVEPWTGAHNLRLTSLTFSSVSVLASSVAANNRLLLITRINYCHSIVFVSLEARHICLPSSQICFREAPELC